MWMEDHVQPFSVHTMDITGHLIEAACHEQHVVHYTCWNTKWSWCKVFVKNNDLTDVVQECCVWVTKMKETVTMVEPC